MADNLTPNGANPVTKTQPQVVQLEVLMKQPLIKGAQVELFDQLWDYVNYPEQANPKYHYQHKIVWVKERKAHYYLDNGDGLSPQNWKKSGSSVTTERWSPTEIYLQGEVVYLDGKLYSSLVDDNIGHSPADDNAYDSDDDYWLCISGEAETYRYIFGFPTPTWSAIIYTEIRNPKFEVFLGTINFDANGDPVINQNDGLVEFIDVEPVEVVAIPRLDISPNNGLAYEICFYEDELQTNAAFGTTGFQGIINIK